MLILKYRPPLRALTRTVILDMQKQVRPIIVAQLKVEPDGDANIVKVGFPYAALDSPIID
jgi:hypothetical protein